MYKRLSTTLHEPMHWPTRTPPRPPAGGASLSEAFEQVALAMFNYMTPIDDLKEDPSLTQ